VKIRYASFFAVSTADIIAIVKGVFKTMVFFTYIVLRNSLKLNREHHAGFLNLSGNEIQTVGPAIEKGRRPYVLSRQQRGEL